MNNRYLCGGAAKTGSNKRRISSSARAGIAWRRKISATAWRQKKQRKQHRHVAAAGSNGAGGMYQHRHGVSVYRSMAKHGMKYRQAAK